MTTEILPPIELLRWYLDAGADEAIGEHPVDRYAIVEERAAKISSTPPAPSVETPREPSLFTADDSTAHLAMDCNSLAELRTALESYEGCALRQTCRSTVFADGNPNGRVMLIGEAPGAEEDRQGLPFVGPSGRLLDRMLESIGLNRTACYITNVVPWRPPGNRKPDSAEVETCLPFIVRHIELVAPEILVFLGSTPTTALLARHEPINRLRGRWFDYSSARLARPVAALPTYHPAFLLRTPSQKAAAWHDMLAIYKRLQGLA